MPPGLEVQRLVAGGWWLVALLQVAVYQIYLLLAELNWVTDSRTCTLLSTNVKYHHYSNSTVDPI